MLRELVPRFLLDSRPDDLLELIDKIALSVPDGEHRQLVFESVFDTRNVDRFVRFLKSRDEPLAQASQRRAREYLPEGSGEAMTTVLPMFLDFDAQNREIVLAYMRRHIDGHQEKLASVALEADRKVALELVDLVATVIDLATASALHTIMAHPEVDVRQAALRQMAREYPGEVDDILLEMVQDADANIRVEALKLASATKSDDVETFLIQRALGADFHELPFTERRLILETLLGIDPEGAEETLLEIIGRKLNLRLDPAVHTTRTIAIGLLGQSGRSVEAFEALEEIASRRLGNPSKVRDAAKAAIARWEERR